MKRFLKEFIISVIFFSIFLFLLGTSLYGVTTPDATPVRTVGLMQLATFKYGISLYQGNQGQYYTFSPTNDYSIGPDNTRNSLISDQELNQNKYQSSFKQSHWNDIQNTIEGYFQLVSPEVTFRTTKTMYYSTQINGNKLRVSDQVNFASDNATPRSLGMTMSYRGADFVYDATGNTYTFLSDEDKAMFEKIYGIGLTQNVDALRVAIPDGKIIIINPDVPGAIIVRALDGQHLFVNRSARLVEVEQLVKPQDGAYTNTIQVEVYANPKEAQKAL